MHITWFPLTISPPPKWFGENKGYHRWWIRKMSCLLGGPPNNYGKRLLSQLVGSRSALDYCGNCAATTAFSKRAFAAQRVKATQVLNNFICWTTRKKNLLVCIERKFLHDCQMQKKGELHNVFPCMPFAHCQKRKIRFSFWFQRICFSVTITNKAFLLLSPPFFAVDCHRQVSWIQEEKRPSLALKIEALCHRHEKKTFVQMHV